MLTAEQIDALRDRAAQLVEPVTEFLISDIAQRIAEAGQLTSTASYEVWRAQQLGISQRQLKKELRKRLQVSHRELRKLLTQAAEVGYDFDIQRFPYVQALPFEKNAVLQQIVQAAVQLAQEDFTNITQTLGMVDPYGNALPLQDAYRSACDYAFEQVSTGAADYNTAIRRAVKNLADKGVRTIDYESGVHTSLEAAVRRNVMGGLGLMQEKISQQNHDDLGCDGWEISAHAASAPDHEPIQGRQYSDEAYEKLNNSLVRRIGTLNCGHYASPIILGVNSPQFTPEELEKMRQDNEKGVDYNGRHYTMYEATQRQRKLEERIRTQKRKILIDETTGDQEKLQADQIRYQVLNQEYKRFSKTAGLRLQHERMEVPGFGPKQARAAEQAAEKAANNDGSGGKTPSIKPNDSEISQVFKLNSNYRTPAGSFDLEKAKKDYSDFLTSAPEKSRILLDQSLASVEYEQTKLRTTSFGYSTSRDKVLYDPTRSDFWDVDFTVANTHELAHRIDHFFVQSADNSDFSTAITNASKTFEENPNKFLAYCRKNDEQGLLSDIFSAVTNGKYSFPAGHDAGYWARAGNKEREVFANLFSLEAFQDIQKLEYLRENFGELFSAFEKLEY